MINLSDAAVTEVKRFIENASYDSYPYLRVGVAGGGCAGFDYKLSFVDESEYTEDTYNKYNQDGITIIVDKKSELYIDGTTIDWESKPLTWIANAAKDDPDIHHVYSILVTTGFTFNNPNASRTCGCGESFSV